MTSVAGSGVGGRPKRTLKERLTLFVVPVAYTYTPLNDLQEKMRILSAPPLPTGRQARLGPGPIGREPAYPALAGWGACRSMGIEIAIFQ